MEGDEECDDGNVVDGDCCSPTCTFDPQGAACEDNLFCTTDDVCDGMGACNSGPEIDCGDGNVCTDDSCDDEFDECVNEFDASNDPTCDLVGDDQPTLTRTTSCAFALGSADVCFDFAQGAGDMSPGGPDEITAVDWCITWEADELSIDCTDGDGSGVPDSVEFFVEGPFTTSPSAHRRIRYASCRSRSFRKASSRAPASCWRTGPSRARRWWWSSTGPPPATPSASAHR